MVPIRRTVRLVVLCSDEEAKVLSFQCTDAPGFDRADFHRMLNAQMLEFFRKTLASDQGGPALRRK